MEIDQAHSERFAGWLLNEVILEGRGDRYSRLPVGPAGRFWLGRIAPAVKVAQSRLGARAERLEPCEIGIRVRPSALDGRTARCRARLVAWKRIPGADNEPETDKWEKTAPIEVLVDVLIPRDVGLVEIAGRVEIAAALRDSAAMGLAAEVHAEIEAGKDGPQLVLTLVNTSPEEIPDLDTNLYEVELEADVGPTVSFLLDGLPDSFRYDRQVAAYGVNGGVNRVTDTVFRTTDFATFDKLRPDYWDEEIVGPAPDVSFAKLDRDPIRSLEGLVAAFARWTEVIWSEESLDERRRTATWDDAMFDLARTEAEHARAEVQRIRSGLALLRNDPLLRRAFSLANRAFETAPSIVHKGWRPFQLGFLLANLAALPPESREAERAYVDTLWFATGGGKTETYLLFTLTAAFYDRLTGKHHGITSWGRFPLRMLSLQQTQRFADVFAAAELIRQKEKLPGDEFAVGFLVGEGGSPNRIPKEPRPGQPDPTDPDMPARYRVLIRCPFCGSEDLKMQFDERRWALDHLCLAAGCPWRARPLPFRIVDEEIYRWLPTVVLGTLDKAASVAVQAAMRGFYGAPEGRCPAPDHGFTYAPRSKSPNGCLFPGCNRGPLALDQEGHLFPPTIRMQDELHLLRDSLGSIDAHYEALLDALQSNWNSSPKLIASSATLNGHEEQVGALYRRSGRMFPLPGREAARSFWSCESDRLARRYIGVAPRGVTLEYANDRIITTLQVSIRRALTHPTEVALEVGIPPDLLPNLVWAYGVDVVYGSTLKDVEAAARSFEAQIPIERLNSAMLTGRTPLDEVRSTLERLTKPEPVFDDRVHLIAASSMLSHGVDIDRLNVMIMLGLPLSTAEFIQTTSRVGRAHPGLVFVLHKIGRERDAAVFRMFPSFIEHMDRLVDPVPITSKSRRVLELTFAGLEQGRIYGLHEAAALAHGLRQLTLPAALKRAFSQLPVIEANELNALVEMLGFIGPLDENLRQDLTEYVRQFYRALNDPASTAQWVSDLFPTGNPMRSLRDVEDQVPVYSRGGVR
jgi:Helicase conserved C-terminal domain